MSDVDLVQGDTAPLLTGQILKEDGSAMPLTSVSGVRFQMRKADDRRYTVDAAATVTDSALGKVSYAWQANDLDVPGDYVAQWQLTYTDLRVETTDPPNTITVRRQ